MIPTIHPSSSRFSRFCAHLKSGLKRLVARFHPASFRQDPKISNEHPGVPIDSVQWQLDCPYSEKPLYQNTVVYVDLNSQKPDVSHKKRQRGENHLEEDNIKITHFPTTHRLH